MSEKRYVMHVLSHTHWDREWYQEFQGFRQRLVFQIDMLMDLLEKRPEYKHFHLDGQTICLEDYLQIRPEMSERLTKHLRSGRILVGPWYVMPDELLLSGESLVRNLMLGHAVCRQFDISPMAVGYVTDIFGHCSQFPQILAGFGIDTAFLHRGTSNADGASEMVWQGADGTAVLLIKAYPYTGYNDFLAYRSANEETLREFERNKKEFASTHVLFALEGNDHTPAYTDTPECIDRLNGVFKEIEVKHSSMMDYLNELKQALGGDLKRLKRYTGELRTPKKTGMYAELFYGTASARVPLKQRNDELEWLLARVAEPLNAFASADPQKPFLDLAWKYLITNHPHDSMVGCSIDQVHRDMIYRFDQAGAIGRNSIGESMTAVGDRLDTESLGDSYAVVTVYNPSSVEIGAVVSFPFEILRSYADEQAAKGSAPVVYDDRGNPCSTEMEVIEPYAWPNPQVKKVHGDSPSFFRRENGYLPHYRFEAEVVGSIPAFGYRSWRVTFASPEADFTAENAEDAEVTADRPGHVVLVGGSPDMLSAAAVSDRDRSPGERCPGPVGSGRRPEWIALDEASRTMENEFLTVVAREDGLIDVCDKTNGTWYRSLQDFEDCGDAGSGWDHVYPENDVVFRACRPGTRSRPRIRFLKKGSLSARISVSFDLMVPEGLTEDRKGRSPRKVMLPVTMLLTLRAGIRRLDIKTTVTNTARDHRLRALFPTNRETDVWFGDSAFDVVKRNIRLPDTTGWDEQAREETPIKNFAAVQDSKGGFAVVTKGLCEAAVRDNPDKTLALTLFRSFSQQIGDGWTLDSQLLRDLKFDYSIVPFTPEPSGIPTQLFEDVERYKLSPVSITAAAHTGDLRVSGRFLETPKGLVVSTVKTAEDGHGIVIRLFNPGMEKVSGQLKLQSAAQQAWKCDMLERKVEPLTVSGGAVKIGVGPKEVQTVYIDER